MRAALLIARKDLRQRIRDRSALVVAVVAPVAVAALMSLAFRGAENFSFTLGIVNLDHGTVASALTRAFDEPGLRTVVKERSFPDEGAARAAVKAGRLDAALIIPGGFTASVDSPRPASLTTLTTDNDAVAGEVTASVVQSFLGQLNADRLSVVTALAVVPGAAEAQLVADATHLHIPVQAATRPLGDRPLKLISYYAPGMATFFLLFSIGYTSRSFFVDRAQGMIERMRAAPVRPAEILVGKALSVFVYGAASLAVVALITSWAFGADWGTPVAGVLLGAVLVASVVCLTAFVIGVARNQRQAEAISSIVIFALALLGGSFFFLSTAPSILQRLSLLTPNGWALRGYTDLATLGGGVGTVVEPVLGILAFSVVAGAVALSLAPRTVTR